MVTVYISRTEETVCFYLSLRHQHQGLFPGQRFPDLHLAHESFQTIFSESRLELLRSAGLAGRRAKVHRYRHLRFDHLHCVSGPHRSHGELVPDTDQHQVNLPLEQGHVAKQVGIAGMVDPRAVLDGDQEPAGVSRIQEWGQSPGMRSDQNILVMQHYFLRPAHPLDLGFPAGG